MNLNSASEITKEIECGNFFNLKCKFFKLLAKNMDNLKKQRITTFQSKINNLKNKIEIEKNKISIPKIFPIKRSKFEETLIKLKTVLDRIKMIVEVEKEEKQKINNIKLIVDEFNEDTFPNLVMNKNIVGEEDCEELNIDSFHSRMKRKLVNLKIKNDFYNQKISKVEISQKFMKETFKIKNLGDFLFNQSKKEINNFDNSDSEKNDCFENFNESEIKNQNYLKKEKEDLLEIEKKDKKSKKKIDLSSLKLKLNKIKFYDNLDKFSHYELIELKFLIEKKLVNNNNHNFPTFRNLITLKNSKLNIDENIDLPAYIFNKKFEIESSKIQFCKNKPLSENLNFSIEESNFDKNY